MCKWYMQKIDQTIAPYVGAKAGAIGSKISEMLYLREQELYIETHCGMANVGLNIGGGKRIFNDVSPKVVSLIHKLSVRNTARELFMYMLDKMEYTRENFHKSKEIAETITNKNFKEASIEQVGSVWFLLLSSYNGTMESYSSDTQNASKRLRYKDTFFNKYYLPEHLIGVEVQCVDAINLINQYKDDEKATLYCDPPYTFTTDSPETRQGREKGKLYENDLGIEGQKKFVETIKDSKAKCAVSAYENDIYNKVLLVGCGWKCNIVDAERQIMMAKKKQSFTSTRKIEVLYTNYEISGKMR